MQKVRQEIIEKILSSHKAIAHLMIAFNIGESGVTKMVKRNDLRLTTPLAIQGILEGTGIKEDEIFEMQEAIQ